MGAMRIGFFATETRQIISMVLFTVHARIISAVCRLCNGALVACYAALVPHYLV